MALERHDDDGGLLPPGSLFNLPNRITDLDARPRPSNQPAHASLLALYTALLHLRRTQPALTDPRFSHTRCICNEDERWLVVERGQLRVVVGLADAPVDVTVDIDDPVVLLATRDDIVVTGGTRSGAAVRLPGCAAVVLDGSVLSA